MKSLYLLVSILSLSFLSSAQLNLDSIGYIDLNTMHSQGLNDIWGYVDEFNNEYAIVGGTKGTSVVDISNPANPVEVHWEPGMTSTWRDIKTWGDYAYVTTEADNGLLIMDLTPLPGGPITNTALYTGPVGNSWDSAHNIYIDSAGYAYIFGSDRGNGGVIILDLNPDPMNPVEVGVFDDWYTHDGFADNDTLYAAHISDGFMSVIDVTDRSNPILLGTANTPGNFAHNIWTKNGQYAFTTDEISGGYIGAFDVSDPLNIMEIDRIQSSPGMGVIPHNTHVLGNHIITSYYSDGVVVHDVTYPYNLIEVGNYDTYPSQTPGYEGCWGVFPFFPSGLIVAADRTEGMFVLNPTYVQAAYLEGITTDASTTNPLDGVQITIAGGNQSELSDFNGFYATGMVTAGTYSVTYSKVGYYPQTISTTLTNGVITVEDVALTPIPQFGFNVTVLEQGTNDPIDGAQITLVASLITHTGVTNATGQENFLLYYEEPYDVYIGKWGYITYCTNMMIDNATGTITVILDTGYYDDYTFDFGWTVSGDAVTGIWERGEPYGTSSLSNPDEDVTGDCGDQCYVTGNAASLNADLDDVDGGTTTLKSPMMDLSNYVDPYLHYDRQFYNLYGPMPPPDDTLKVFISNGIQTVLIDTVGYDPGLHFQWINKNLRILDYISLTSTMQVRFEVSDLDPAINITEAAVDYFYITEEGPVGLEELEMEFAMYPNPASQLVTITGYGDQQNYRLKSTNGSVVSEGSLHGESMELDVSKLHNGIYFLSIGTHTEKLVITK